MLLWSLAFDEGVARAVEAADCMVRMDGPRAAAGYLAGATRVAWAAGSTPGAWALAAHGLSYAAGEQMDGTGAYLMSVDISRREAQDPTNPGIPLDTAERRIVAGFAEAFPLLSDELQVWQAAGGFLILSSRRDIYDRFAHDFLLLGFIAGEFRAALPPVRNLARRSERDGQIAKAAQLWSQVARLQNALGDLADAAATCRHAQELGSRLATRSMQTVHLAGAMDEICLASDDGWIEFMTESTKLAGGSSMENKWFKATILAAGARILARLGRRHESWHCLPKFHLRSNKLRAGHPTTRSWRAMRPKPFGC